jgi:CRP/FNR family transcriptional regulator, cyclic AMP receptor protein
MTDRHERKLCNIAHSASFFSASLNVFLCLVSNILLIFTHPGANTLIPLMKSKDSRRFNPEAFLQQIGAGRTLQQFKKRQVIFSQGEAADAVYFIQQGRVRLSLVSKSGKEAILALMGAGDFLGEECVSASQPRRFTTATALSEITLLKIKKRTMLNVLKTEHKFSEMFVAFLLARNAHFQEDLTDQLFNRSEKRLARVLLQLAQFGKEGGPESVVPKISQEMLAEMVGTTRARVSFFMNRFRKMGFIQYNGGLKIHSSLLNVILHD